MFLIKQEAWHPSVPSAQSASLVLGPPLAAGCLCGREERGELRATPVPWAPVSPLLPGLPVHSALFRPDLLAWPHGPHCRAGRRPGPGLSAVLVPAQPPAARGRLFKSRRGSKCLLSSMNSHGWPVAPMLAGGDRPRYYARVVFKTCLCQVSELPVRILALRKHRLIRNKDH